MAINWTEAQIEEVVAAVLKGIKTETRAATSGWDSTQYNGRKLIGVYADMNDAIDAATAGYKAIRAMSLEEREKVIKAVYMAYPNRDIQRGEIQDRVHRAEHDLHLAERTIYGMLADARSIFAKERGLRG